jgi:hypothetical protein
LDVRNDLALKPREVGKRRHHHEQKNGDFD